MGIPSSIEQLFSQAVGRNGSVNQREVDQWIAQQLSINRTSRVIASTIDTQTPVEIDAKIMSEERVIKSSWSKIGVDGESFDNSQPRGWRTGTGIRLLLERKQFDGS